MRVTAKTDRERKVGDREIDRRVSALGELSTRVGDLKRLNATARQNILSSLKAQIDGLTGVKIKIDADTDEDTLKADVKSVTDAYRIFALVLPQARIIIMADGEVYVSDAELTLSAKLDARIKAAAQAGKDVTALNTGLADMQAKANDAKVQAQNAVALITGLQPDGGDKTKMDANTKALMDAKAKLKAGRDDLTAARADASKIATALKGIKLDATTTTSSAPSSGTPTGTSQ
jgi:hypothetical protein